MRARAALVNSYLVRMSNRPRYRDEMFIIEFETRREKERGEEERESFGARRIRIFN